MNRKMTVAACVLWLAGLAAFIVGLNIKSDTGRWLSIVGQIVFLVGLALEGVLWFRKKNAEETAPEKEKPEEPESSGEKN